jgi:hypothetical protein
MKKITADVLVVGGGAGGIAAAIQASRYGVKTILATEFSWLGGMLTSAGVAAPDGNELASWHTGLWGAYLQELQQRQTEGLDWGWVSLFTYQPNCGAKILADWVAQIPNLQWVKNCKPWSVIQQNNCITGVNFQNLLVEAKITIDATELGDLLALADIPYRWGWESFEEFNEPSLQENQEVDFDLSGLSKKYPVQAPTWVFILQDYGQQQSKVISQLSSDFVNRFQGAWDSYGGEKFLNYGQLNHHLYMINWPIAGNDYGVNLNRLIASETATLEWLSEAYYHSHDFARYIQTELGRQYGLANNIFPQQDRSLLPNLDAAFALHPYYRESRRLQGNTTITEHHILPLANGCVAPLPINEAGEVDGIAIGNYANDHHYPGIDFKLKPKSIRWGGRWTGTPFTIPYQALVPKLFDGLLVCEKNISVSHIANGSTRLQPVVMNIGQAAGVAAALSVRYSCQPRELVVREIQEVLLTDKVAPAAVIPLINLTPHHPQWLFWQRYYLEHPEAYPLDGNCPNLNITNLITTITGSYYSGIFQKLAEQNYNIILVEPLEQKNQIWQLITIYPEVDRQLLELKTGQLIKLVGKLNRSGNWLSIEKINNVT